MVTQFMDEEVLLSLADRLISMKSRFALHPIIKARIDLLAAARQPFLEASTVLGLDVRRRLVSEELVQSDRRFDGLVRGIDALFEAWTHLGHDRTETEKVLELRTELLPEGRYVTLRSYSGEREFGMRLEQCLTEGNRRLLSAIPSIEGRTLLAEILDLVQVAERIGLLLAEQTRLKTAADTQTLSNEEAWERKKRLAKELEKLAEEIPEVVDDSALVQEAIGPLAEAQAKSRSSRGATKELAAALPIPLPAAKKTGTPRKRPRFRTEGQPEGDNGVAQPAPVAAEA
ncbi:MAG: hypothetical protein HYV07_33235 [Deltaproteobacteria bacterium]|nr:hypothetical protein [Deltaproteobacteria bacterium]